MYTSQLQVILLGPVPLGSRGEAKVWAEQGAESESLYPCCPPKFHKVGFHGILDLGYRLKPWQPKPCLYICSGEFFSFSSNKILLVYSNYLVCLSDIRQGLML